MTKRISRTFVLKRLMELLIGNVFLVYLTLQHIIPISEDARGPIRRGEWQQILSYTLKMAVPAAYFWLTMFYSVFHSYLNLFAELTRFGDRRFYSDWWNANDLGEYWRKWN